MHITNQFGNCLHKFQEDLFRKLVNNWLHVKTMELFGANGEGYSSCRILNTQTSILEIRKPYLMYLSHPVEENVEINEDISLK
ncbi:hypothetical protein F8M41_020140 [Gigaspora margarita]|uniref:Uncharacterized protein n=1 Tax=Gigaspora margarita TaxID=4874 RepID=A0A8H4AIZ9_GIGMA|nr:hypothetical protein F8M41_020140 [Gigaspora margarita]